MNKVIILLLILIFTGELRAQQAADTLIAKRKVFTTSVYRKGVRLNNSRLFDLYAKSKAYNAEKQLKGSRILIPVGAGISVAGLALSVNSLIGTKHTVVIDNVEHTYFKRPIINLLGGIGMLTAGISLMEFGNDKRMQSVDLYNKKKKHDALHTRIGFNEQGHLGLRLSF